MEERTSGPEPEALVDPAEGAGPGGAVGAGEMARPGAAAGAGELAGGDGPAGLGELARAGELAGAGEPAGAEGPRPLGVGVTPTGQAAVDTGLRRLADADHLPSSGHLQVYEDVHRGLRDVLASLDQHPGPPAPSSTTYDNRS